MIMSAPPGDKVLIIDFGSQYSQLIARRIRELAVYSEIHSWQRIDRQFIEDFSPRCIILSGGPESVTGDGDKPELSVEVFSLGIPILGICYGMQLMADLLGGVVAMSPKREFGHTTVKILKHGKLFHAIPSDIDVWMSHGDKVKSVPEGFFIAANSSNSPVAAMADERRNFYGLQFHPEVTHTEEGMKILDCFVKDISGCRKDWNAKRILSALIDDIRTKVGDEEVVLGLSGGVDSSVAAALIHQAIGNQLHCVFVDTGLLRLGEAQQVVKTFGDHIGIELVHVTAEEKFLVALQGVQDPEDKRRVIGNLFIQIFEQEAEKLKTIRWLAQGTIYPDVIESAGTGGNAHLIKSHHNVGGLPERMNLRLLEPLSNLFKDEVRRLGLELGLPAEIIDRHPFPGPGLGVRVLGEVKKTYVELLRQVDYIFIEELKSHGLYNEVAQAFAVFLPVKSVGVMGDRRDYSYVVSLRAVETTDFMTAKSALLPPKFLDLVAGRIINEVSGISRVCYDISSKPPATIEWE